MASDPGPGAIGSGQRRLKVLLVGEAVTLAHVARPVALARALGPERYELVMACAPAYAGFMQDGDWAHHELPSIAPSRFLDALDQGAPVYDLATLSRYVEDDLRLIDRVRPDVVVGDFRISLAVSARLASVPYLAIANAYWCPGSEAAFPMPVMAMTRATRWLPLLVQSALFGLGSSLLVPWQHCRPMNRLRERHGLPGLGADLRRVYADADHLLVPDIAELYPLPGASVPHSYVGALTWSPQVPVPDGLPAHSDPAARPLVYVALGSSGPPAALDCVLQALADEDVTVAASTAGATNPPARPRNAVLERYLPGDAMSERARLVVCNGGSLSVQQALMAGTPVLALATNMDQFLNMAPVAACGAGIVLRTDRLSPETVRRAAQALLASVPAQKEAARLGALLRRQPRPEIAFAAALASLLPRR